MIDFSEHPVGFIALFFLGPLIHEAGFYIAHRPLHWPPLHMPEGEQAAARTRSQLRFEQLIGEVARRLRTDRNLMARVEARLRETVQKTSPDKPGQDADHASTTSQCVPGGPSEIDRDA